MKRTVLAVALALVAAVGWRAPAWAEDAPPPPPPPAPIERLFLPVKEQMKDLTPFLRDTDLKVHFRSFYFNREKPDDTNNEAWAFGGWISYTSGLLLDTFSMGATLYGSAPLYAPDDRDGTLLLKPGQKGYYVPGEAWGALQYKDYAILKGYRQLVDQPYINAQDNRMTPNTFQGVTLGGKFGWLQYFAGYLWEIKPRNSDKFISMAEQAGAANSNDGVGLFGVRLTPIKGLRFDVSEQYGVNTFNTVYGEADYLHPLNDDWKIRFSAQFTDQRATGDALINTAEKKFWSTQQGGMRAQVIYRDLTLTTAFSVTGSGQTIQAPWGSFPGYASLMDQDFDRAQEKAITVGIAYDFNKLVTGLSAFTSMAWGRDAINPSTRVDAPNQDEYDFTVDYRPPFFGLAFLKGMWFRFRSDILDQQDAKKLGYQFRLVINWERDLI
jgi:outer membrane OprD family porin